MDITRTVLEYKIDVWLVEFLLLFWAFPGVTLNRVMIWVFSFIRFSFEVPG